MYEAIYSHTDEYTELAGNLQKQLSCHKAKREKGLISDQDFCIESQEIQSLSHHLQDLEWHAPDWEQINKALRKHRSASDKKRFLEDLTRELAAYISSIQSHPEVRNKWHLDIDRIDYYLDALIALQNRINLEISYLSRSIGMEEYRGEKEELPVPALHSHLLISNNDSQLSVDELAKRDILTFDEVMLYLGKGRSTIYRWMAEQKIPSLCYRGKKRNAQFYRDKLDKVFFPTSESVSSVQQYQKINWLRDSSTAKALLKELAASDYIEAVKYSDRVFDIDGEVDLITSRPINWVFRPNAIQDSLEFLISLIFLLIDYKAIKVRGTGKKTQTTAYIKKHFKFCETEISDRTLEAAKQMLFQEDGEFIPRDQIKDLLKEVFGY